MPGAGDVVLIDVGVAAITVTHASGTTSILGLLSDEAIVLSGGSFSIAAASQVTSTLTLSGATLTAAADLNVANYTQTAGALVLAGGSISSSTTLDIQGGSLSGAGTINANASINGLFSPGSSPGIINISGDLILGPSSVTNIEIDGLTPGSGHDQVNVSGTATLDGTLNMTLIGAFVPGPTDVFTVMTFGSRVGDFATKNLAGLRHSYNATSLNLSQGIIVNSTADPGDGVCDQFECTLREAINEANATLGSDAIVFNIPGTGPHTIQPSSALPNFTEAVIIDGYTEPGASANTLTVGSDAVLMIELDGTNAGTSGLTITAADSTVRGLVINRFSAHGILITGSGATNNVVEGNFIGTDVTGAVARPNIGAGVRLEGGSAGTIVGGTTSDERNVISANLNGIRVIDSPDNIIQGNFIGTDVTGTLDLGNDVGVFLESSTPGVPDSTNNLVGGSVPGAGNLVSGNVSGVRLQFADTTNNLVEGNLIGTEVTGTGSLPNEIGVVINRAANNTIGGTTAAQRNVISGNSASGIHISGSESTDNEIFGNFIGTDITGSLDLGNLENGVVLDGGTQSNTVGGAIAGAGNVISGNNLNGVLLDLHFRGLGCEGNQVLEECPQFAVVWAMRQSGQELFSQHFSGDRASPVRMRGATVRVVPTTISAVTQLRLVHVPTT